MDDYRSVSLVSTGQKGYGVYNVEWVHSDLKLLITYMLQQLLLPTPCMHNVDIGLAAQRRTWTSRAALQVSLRVAMPVSFHDIGLM